jgi:uncharacterized protein YuzE
MLRVAFRDPKSVAQSRDVEVVVDLDEFGDPCGIEVIGLRAALGIHVAEVTQLAAGRDVRFSYDHQSDSAAIGVSVGSGTRVRESVPRRATAGLDSDGHLVMFTITI